MASSRIDLNKLSDVVMQCLDLSMDGRLHPDDRAAFLAHGKRLRGLWVNMATMFFDDQSAEFGEASARLKAVNARLKRVADELDKVADRIEQVGALVGTLDKLLGLAVAFV